MNNVPSIPSIRDNVVSQVPGHILESYPRFREFLEAYYEWVHEEGNPYERVKYHMEYLDFQKSLDDFVDMMKTEYLKDVPNKVLVDKELFIKWSKKLHLTRGSHASYKFLFKLLFDEQDTRIYLPKENILRTSDGEWVYGEHKIFLSNTFPINDLVFQTITQEREISPGFFEHASATIESFKRFYSGRYDLLEVTIVDIKGEFKSDYPITTQPGGQGWLVPTIRECVIDNKGYNHNPGERIVIQGLNEFVINHEGDETGRYDTRVTSRFHESELTVSIDGSNVTDFTFDGQFVIHPSITPTSNVEVIMPPYEGYMIVGDVTPDGAVRNIHISEPPIGTHLNDYSIVNDGYGTGLIANAVSDNYNKVSGYYKSSKGHLSSDMYLQDSFYYQDYSYAIRTYKDLDSYADVVKNYLHPAGFEMFGIMNIIFIIEQLLELHSTQEHVITTRLDDRARWSLGPNYSFIDRIKRYPAMKRLYRNFHLKGGYKRDYYGEDEYFEDYYVYTPPIYNQGYEAEEQVGSEHLLDNTLERTYDSLYDERASGLDLIPFDDRHWEFVFSPVEFYIIDKAVNSEWPE